MTNTEVDRTKLDRYIVSVFGKTGLVRLGDESPIKHVACEFLRNVGLPAEEILLIRFQQPKSTIGEIKIGHVGDSTIVVHEDGTVSSRDTVTNEDSYMNASVRQLIACLASYATYSDLCYANQSQGDEYAEEFERFLREIDASAMGNSSTWWSQIVQQTRHGLL